MTIMLWPVTHVVAGLLTGPQAIINDLSDVLI